MPASAVQSAFTGNDFLEAIDTHLRWSGTITVNRIDTSDPAERALFNGALNPVEYGTHDNGLSNTIWNLIVQSFDVMKRYSTFTWADENTATDANYFASDFFDEVFTTQPAAGIAGFPGGSRVIAFDPKSTDNVFNTTKPMDGAP